MPARFRPALPIPAPLRGTEPGSFAYRTITERMPRIGQRVIEENAFEQEVVVRLQALMAELPDGSIRPLTDVKAPDAADWVAYVEPYRQQNWLQVPWFFAETYFYRRILEATGYFVEGAGFQRDPYRPHKEQSRQSSSEKVRGLAQRLARWWEAIDEPVALREALAMALWGNQGDLSMWPAGSDMPSHEDEATAHEHLLADERDEALAYLAGRRGEDDRIDIIADNVGMELASDLALVDVLLGGSWAATLVLDVKFHPTFVSDAVPRDVRHTMRFLLSADDEAANAWGQRLLDYADSGRLFLRQHAYWNSPLEGWKMPAELRQTLAEASLVIVKGDANYRRLLGDRHWDYTTPFEPIVRYFPAPLLALRTLKSNVAAGLDEHDVATLQERDPAWVVSGEWGVIQFRA